MPAKPHQQPQELSIVHWSEEFSHSDAARIFDVAMRCASAKTVVIDLKRARTASTSAFAGLVLLRRMLLKRGRDLRLEGLEGRAASVYKLNRLAAVLPRQ